MQQKFNWFDVALYAFMALILLVIVFPLWFLVIASFSDPTLVNTGQVVLIPRGITFEGYTIALQDISIWRGYWNSIVYTVLFTGLGLALILPAAYGLQQSDLLWQKPIMALFMFTMFFGGGVIPSYLLIRDLKLLDTLWALVLPGAVSVYNMIVARTFFSNTIPAEVQESARIDGCGDFMTFIRIVLPLSKAIVAVLALWYAVGMWNSYFSALIYIRDASKHPLQMVLREILFRNQQLANVLDGDPKTFEQLNRVSQLLRYVVMIVASVPMLCAYPFVQKHFVKGVMIGSVKG